MIFFPSLSSSSSSFSLSLYFPQNVLLKALVTLWWECETSQQKLYEYTLYKFTEKKIKNCKIPIFEVLMTSKLLLSLWLLIGRRGFFFLFFNTLSIIPFLRCLPTHELLFLSHFFFSKKINSLLYSFFYVKIKPFTLCGLCGRRGR